MQKINSLGSFGILALLFSVFLWFYADPSGFGIYHLGSLAMLLTAKACFTALVFDRN